MSEGSVCVEFRVKGLAASQEKQLTFEPICRSVVPEETNKSSIEYLSDKASYFSGFCSPTEGDIDRLIKALKFTWSSWRAFVASMWLDKAVSRPCQGVPGCWVALYCSAS